MTTMSAVFERRFPGESPYRRARRSAFLFSSLSEVSSPWSRRRARSSICAPMPGELCAAGCSTRTGRFLVIARMMSPVTKNTTPMAIRPHVHRFPAAMSSSQAANAPPLEPLKASKC